LIESVIVSFTHLPVQIKKNFTEVLTIRNLSGFGWHEGFKLPTATQDVWDRLFAVVHNPTSHCFG
jgi:hypothetical protein